jgi:flagellar motor switch protein FliM
MRSLAAAVAFPPTLKDAVFRRPNNGYARAWQPTYPIELTQTRSEMRPADVAIVGASEMMISFDLSVTIGAASGVLSLCIACAALEPIRDKLHGVANALLREPSDQRRVDTLADQIKGVAVQLVAELAQGQMTVAELLALKVGDFVEFDLRESLLVTIGTRCEYKNF